MESVDLFGGGAQEKSSYLVDHLTSARIGKVANDEFYTLDEDVWKMIEVHGEDLRGKRVFSNCDGPQSAFTRIFEEHGERLGLRSFQAHVGPFQGSESLAILAESDLVITNPPFSLMHGYIDQIIRHEVEFLIVVPSQWLAFKRVFPSIARGSYWASGGWSALNRFLVPEDYPKGKRGKDGRLYGSVACTWLTNLPRRGDPPRIEASAKFDPAVHRKCDDYDAIFVPALADIPIDYPGVMSVPMTLLGCPDDRIAILGTTSREQPKLDGKTKFVRLFVKWKWACDGSENPQQELAL